MDFDESFGGVMKKTPTNLRAVLEGAWVGMML
jgi:hypothetical protein